MRLAWNNARQYEAETTLNGRAVFVRVSRPHGASKWSAEASYADDGDHSRFGRGARNRRQWFGAQMTLCACPWCPNEAEEGCESFSGEPTCGKHASAAILRLLTEAPYMKDQGSVLGRVFTVFRDLPERNKLTRSRGITATAEEGNGAPVLRWIDSEAPRDGFPFDPMTIYVYADGIAHANPGITAHETEATNGADGAAIWRIATLAGGWAEVFDTGPTSKATRDPRYLIRLRDAEIARVETFADAKAIACGLANARTDREGDEFVSGALPRGWTLEAPQPV